VLPPLKRDHADIRACIQDLRTKYAREARSWWPSFVFHYTNLENAGSILNGGVLYSRAEAVRRGLMVTDNASQSVIGHTGNAWKEFVRLYFRPRTPTQIHNEGIRPLGARSLESNCPVPVFLLFDSVDALTRSETQFSEYTLAKYGGHAQGSAAAFTKLAFSKIYHNTWFAPDERDEIIGCRHAEVIVPGCLDLSALKYVWCRSQAEKSTLLHLLGPESKRRWADKVFQGKKYDLFFARWTFIETADLSSSNMVFLFNPSTETPGPFSLRVNVSVPDLSSPLVYEDRGFMAKGKLSLRFRQTCSRYTVTLTLDGSLAYKNEFTDRSPVL
jgi:hypothetical protein